MMAAVAARELADGEVVFVGIGLPNLACNLARATHAPRLVLIYESGAVGAVPERLPVSIGDPALVTGSLMVCGMADVFQGMLQNGRIEVGFLGGAQVGPRAFPERVDFVTSPGLRPQGRLRRGLRMPGAGPVKVITDKAILEADEATGEMVLAALYPGVSVPDVQAGVGWALTCRSGLAAVAPPTPQELRLLRDVLDPKRLFLRQ